MSLHNRGALNDQLDTVGASWLGALERRAGPLSPAAERFLAARMPGYRQRFRGGPDGLRWLAAEIERFLDQEDGGDEDVFVEEAGALLGLILIDHTRDGRHVCRGTTHRVAVGPHGYVDPFSAIEHALEADSVKKTLVAFVRCAEAEARSQGPLSRVFSAFAAGLVRERPHLRIVEHFDAKVSLVGDSDQDRVDVDLSSAARATADQGPDAAHAAARRLLSMLPGTPDVRLDFSEARERIVPRLCRSDALHSLNEQGRTALFSLPFVPELVIAVLVEHEGRARYLRAREVESFGIAASVLLAQCLDNLTARSAAFRLTRDEHGLLVARTGDGRDSARVLLPAVREVLVERLGSTPLVGLPHRDTFRACRAHDEPAREALAAQVASEAARAPHRLSEQLYACASAGLCAV